MRCRWLKGLSTHLYIVKLEQRIETRADVSALSVRLTGDYKSVDYSGAWEKIVNYCKKGNRVGCIDAEHISVYLDDPMTTPAEKCTCSLTGRPDNKPLRNEILLQ